jgi:hypothetical protein
MSQAQPLSFRSDDVHTKGPSKSLRNELLTTITASGIISHAMSRACGVNKEQRWWSASGSASVSQAELLGESHVLWATDSG